MDIMLITQGKNLIHKKYLSFVETMFKALSGAKRIFFYSLSLSQICFLSGIFSKHDRNG